MFKFNKELVFYDEKLAPICIVADLLGIVSITAYYFLGAVLPYDAIIALNRVTMGFVSVACLLVVAFFVVWIWVWGKVRQYTITRQKKGLIVFTHILNLLYAIIVVESKFSL